MNHWGETSIFCSRIVLIIRLQTILSAEPKSQSCFTIWSLDTGIFDLHFIDSAARFATWVSHRQFTSDALSRICNVNELLASWLSNSISATELVLRVNAFHMRSFINLDNYPIFPDFSTDQPRFPNASDVIRAMSSVNPFHSFARSLHKQGGGRGFSPADFYFHAFGSEESSGPILLRESLQTDQRLGDWLHRIFSFRLPAPGKLLRKFGEFDAMYNCQPLVMTWRPGTTLLFDADNITVVNGISRHLECGVVHYEPSEMTLSIDTERGMDLLLAFVRGLEVGELGLFFVVDLEVGLTLAFKIEKGQKFVQCSRAESDDWPFTCVSDLDSLAATACGTSRSCGIWRPAASTGASPWRRKSQRSHSMRPSVVCWSQRQRVLYT
jgi:hypothetical protein